MAYTLPNGSTFDIASVIAAPKTITAASNANPGVFTSATHGLVTGDYIVLTSGWTRLNNRVFKVNMIDVTTFSLVGVDTTDVVKYPAGQGIGSFKKITTWVPITQITEVAFAGGEQQFLNFAFLEDSDERQMPTTKSAISMTLTVADDPTLPYVTVVETADQDLQPRPLKLNMIGGSVLTYNAIVNISPTPTLARDELMARDIVLSLQSRPYRV